MLSVKNTILSKGDFFKKLRNSRYVRLAKLEAVQGDIEKMIDSSRDAGAFLYKLDEMTDYTVQMSCRGVVISQMYGVSCSDVSWAASNHDLLMIRIGTTSTAIVSKYGEMLIAEGEIYTHSGLFYGGDFVARSVSDGKIGYFSRSGSVILPCIFDDCDMHIGEANFLWNGVNFKLLTFPVLDADVINQLRYLKESREGIIGMTEDKKEYFVLYQMDLLETDNKYEIKTKEEKDAATKFVTTAVSDMLFDIDKFC